MKNHSIFRFCVRNLGFFKFIPLLALVFDAWLKLWSLITNPTVLDRMDDIEKEVSGWDGASVGLHKYGGVQFNYMGKELGHIHGNGILDICFSRAVKAKLMEENVVSHHHVFPNSGWITLYLHTQADSNYAIFLLKMAYQKRKSLHKI